MVLEDHGCEGGLTLRKIKAHTTISNFGMYHMTYIQWAGNRNADKGAQTTALAMAVELNLAGYVKECDELEKSHRGLCKWIAMVTVRANTDESRDAIPTPDDVVRTSKRRIPVCLPPPKTQKRPRVTATPAARTTGVTSASGVVEVPVNGA